MNKQNTIFISAYRNVSVRYFLYTDILRTLKKDDKLRIVIFLKENDVEYYRNALVAENVTIESVLFSSSMKKLRSFVGNFIYMIRMCSYAEKKGFRNTTTEVWQCQIWKGYSQKIRMRIIFKVVKLVAFFARKMFLVRKAILFLESIIFPGKLYDEYFRLYKPKLLIVSSLGHMIDSFIMRSAKRHNCKVVTVFHNWDNVTTKGYKGCEPDRVVVWNEVMKHEANIFHDINKEKIYIGGVAHWDHYSNGKFRSRSREEFISANGLDSDRRIIFFGAGGATLWPRSLDIVEHIMEHILNDRFIFPTQLMVRLHPDYLFKDKKVKSARVINRYKERIDDIQAKYKGLISFNLPGVHFLNDDVDMPMDDLFNLAERLYYSDILLTQYSTLLLEGSFLDVPIINMGLYSFRETGKPSAFYERCTHINEVLKTGACKNAYTYEQLFEYINLYLKDRSLDSNKRKILVDKMVPEENRGHGGQATGEYILSLL